MDNTKNAVAIQAMQAVIDDYTDKINHLRQSIILLGGNIETENHTPNNNLNVKAPVNLADEAGKFPYPYGKKLRARVQFVFDRENRFMLVREVNEYLIQIEPKLSSEIVGIRNAITNMKQDKLLTSVKTGKSNLSYVWGKPEWLNDDGTIKKEHLYNTDLPEVD